MYVKYVVMFRSSEKKQREIKVACAVSISRWFDLDSRPRSFIITFKAAATMMFHSELLYFKAMCRDMFRLFSVDHLKNHNHFHCIYS